MAELHTSEEKEPPRNVFPTSQLIRDQIDMGPLTAYVLDSRLRNGEPYFPVTRLSLDNQYPRSIFDTRMSHSIFPRFISRCGYCKE